METGGCFAKVKRMKNRGSTGEGCAIELDIDLEAHEILRSLGYKEGTQPSHETMHRLDEIHKVFSNKLQSLGMYRIVDFSRSNNKELLTENGCIESFKVSSLARKAEHLLIGLVTVHNLDETEKQDLLYDYILQGIGNAAVGKSVDSLLKAVESERELCTSLPFSPGYCDWDITRGQEFILNSIDPSIINVKVVPESLRMLPIHTISFVSLLGSQEMERNACLFCNLERCLMRRT
jgi:hypothetical protein